MNINKFLQALMLLIFLYSGMGMVFSGHAQSLQISKDNTHIINRDGSPFVWIGDTAWELFHKLDREEATAYLENRADKEFSIIQAVVLAENDGLRTPNPYGEVPFHNLDPTRPNEKYFEHVDFIVNKARDLGLIMGMLPTWGDKVYSQNPGAGPVVFNEENAAVYGEYLGRRYKDQPVVWILGGDRNVANLEVHRIWKAMAGGIEKGDGGNHLITFHPRGAGISAYWFHNESWLDFNMYQSGHSNRYTPVYEYAEELTMMEPRKPFVDGEPAYEDIAIRFWDYMDFGKPGYQRVPEGVLDTRGLISDKAHFEDGFFTAHDVRVHAYWNFLSGACGYTYGNNAIWQMFKIGGSIAIPPLTDWKEALDRPGGYDMQHVRALFESRPLDKLVPDQSVVYGINRPGNGHVRTASASDRSFIMAYLPKGEPVTVVMDKVEGDKVAWWYDPRNGEATRIGDYGTEGVMEFPPPSSGVGNDWVLVIDSREAGYAEPGKW